jgi:hypothetical protein
MLKSALFGVKVENNSNFCQGTVIPTHKYLKSYGV